MEPNQILTQAVKNRDTKFLVKYYWGYDLSKGQSEIVRIVAFRECSKLSVCAMTRYGKTFCVALGIGLFILMNKNKKFPLIAPKSEQAGILRDYMQDLVLSCKALRDIAELESNKGTDKLKKEASKKRLTFTNGCEYRVFSAFGEAESLMGFGIGSGGGILVKDEATLINKKANAKIGRMIGDNPKESMEIELCNPWDRDNKAFEHWCDPKWKHIHIDWRQALEEGRTNQQYINEQREDLTPIEFEVLYESKFPEQSEDSVFNLKYIKLAEESEIDFKKEAEAEDAEAEKEKDKDEDKKKKKYITKIISCDVADKGLDSTVIYWGFEKDGEKQVTDYYSEPKSENMQVAGRINNLIKEFIGKETKGLVNIDCIGVGVGVVSRVKEFVDEEGYTNIHVNACHFGEKPKNTKRFSNKKGEYYFKLKDLLNEEMIKIPKISKLNQQLISVKWEFNSTSKIKILDPDKSPDFADGLVYFVWEEEGGAGILTDEGGQIFGDIQY